MNKRAIITNILLLVTFIIFLKGCSPGTSNNENEDRIVLAPASPTKVEVNINESVSLRAIVLRQKSGAVKGAKVLFTPVGLLAETSHRIEPQEVVTDSDGIASTTFIAGEEIGEFQVNVSLKTTVPNEIAPEPFRFSVIVKRPVRTLIADPSSIDTVVNTRVRLSVIATTDGRRPLPNETINWSILSGGEGGASLSSNSSVTSANGVSIVTMNTGNSPTIIRVQASMEGTAPVTITVNVNERSGSQCRTTIECPEGYMCIEGVCSYVEPECYTNDDCNQAANEECRWGHCVSPDPQGKICEFDEDCDLSNHEICVAGRCTKDPRYNDTGCRSIVDCPNGFICVNNECIPDPEQGEPDCISDSDCGSGLICENGTCINPGICGNDPELSGYWELESLYRFRDALPDWLDDLLSTVAGPFRFLSEGILNGFDFGNIPIIGDTLTDAANSIVDQYIPPWVGELLGAIADVNDILTNMDVIEEMYLTRIIRNQTQIQYAGEHLWQQVSFVYRGQPVTGSMRDITGMDVIPSQFNALSQCGILYIHDHDLNVSFGYIVRWVLDVIVTIVTRGEYFSLEELLLSLTDYCGNIADAIDELAQQLAEGLDIELPDVWNIVYALCENGIEAGTQASIDWLNRITISVDMITLRGDARISSPTILTNGHWYGELAGRDFTGSWAGRK